MNTETTNITHDLANRAAEAETALQALENRRAAINDQSESAWGELQSARQQFLNEDSKAAQERLTKRQTAFTALQEALIPLDEKIAQQRAELAQLQAKARSHELHSLLQVLCNQGAFLCREKRKVWLQESEQLAQSLARINAIESELECCRSEARSTFAQLAPGATSGRFPSEAARETALQLLQELREGGVEPDVALFNEDSDSWLNEYLSSEKVFSFQETPLFFALNAAIQHAHGPIPAQHGLAHQEVMSIGGKL